DNPRGRLAFIRALAEGELAPVPSVTVHLERCLQCRACEAVCPSGVPFGRLMDATLDEVDRRRRRGLLARLIRWLVLRQLLPFQSRLRLLASFLRLYQRLGVQALVRRSGVLRPFPTLAAMDGLLPPLPARDFVARGQEWPPRGAARL